MSLINATAVWEGLQSVPSSIVNATGIGTVCESVQSVASATIDTANAVASPFIWGGRLVFNIGSTAWQSVRFIGSFVSGTIEYTCWVGIGALNGIQYMIEDNPYYISTGVLLIGGAYVVMRHPKLFISAGKFAGNNLLTGTIYLVAKALEKAPGKGKIVEVANKVRALGSGLCSWGRGKVGKVGRWIRPPKKVDSNISTGTRSIEVTTDDKKKKTVSIEYNPGDKKVQEYKQEQLKMDKEILEADKKEKLEQIKSLKVQIQEMKDIVNSAHVQLVSKGENKQRLQGLLSQVKEIETRDSNMVGGQPSLGMQTGAGKDGTLEDEIISLGEIQQQNSKKIMSLQADLEFEKNRLAALAPLLNKHNIRVEDILSKISSPKERERHGQPPSIPSRSQPPSSLQPQPQFTPDQIDELKKIATAVNFNHNKCFKNGQPTQEFVCFLQNETMIKQQQSQHPPQQPTPEQLRIRQQCMNALQ